METSREIDVTNLDEKHRRALKDVIGTQLHRNQRLIISVTEVDVATHEPPARAAQSISDWTNVYEGLTDQEIEDIDRAVKTRANLTRNLP